MNKLTLLFALATFSLAGCKHKPADEAKANPTVVEDKPKTDTPKVEDKATPPASDLPAECGEYKAAIDKLATCDKLDAATRDPLKSAFDTASAGWAKLSAEDKAKLGASCKAGADAVSAAAKTPCGW
jgi:hypothetical protein